MTTEGPILVVEDDKNDIFFLQVAFEEAGITTPMQVVYDGQEAVDYLAGHGRYSDRGKHPLPCLVLLDLKLPVKMGMDVLRWIGQQPKLKSLIVVVLTSSSEPSDILQAYELGARSYLVKPLTLDKRRQMAQLIKAYWLELNRTPG